MDGDKVAGREELKEIIEGEIRDKIWRRVLLRASAVDKQKVAPEILRTLKLFRRVQESPSDKELLSRFLWNLENEVSLEFRAAVASRKLLKVLYSLKSEHRLLGFYLASWSRVYGRHALVQGLKESVERIDVDVRELRKYSKDLLLLTYLCSSDKNFAKKEVARLCRLTEREEDCQRLIKCLESAAEHTAHADTGFPEESREFVLGTFFTIENTVLYVIHERLVDPLLTEIEELLPEELNTPSKILTFLSRSDEQTRTKVWDFVRSYLDVIP